MNVLNVLSFLRRGHTGAAETVFRAQRGHAGALSHSCSWKRMLDFLLGLVILKNKKLIKTKKNSQLLLDLGMILKWDNLLMSLSIDSMRNKHLEK